MPIERQHVVLYGPKEIVEDGVRHRNKVLQPCGCWAAEVWRAPMVYDAAAGEFKPGTEYSWQSDAFACRVHANEVAVLSLHLAVQVNGQAEQKKFGDGARRLYADRDRILAEAATLNEELKALGCDFVTEAVKLASTAVASGKVLPR